MLDNDGGMSEKELKEFSKLFKQKVDKCPIIGDTLHKEKPTHYCGIIMHKYATQYIYENDLEVQFRKLADKTRAFNETTTVLDQRIDFCAEWYCDWDSKQDVIYSFRNIVETIIRSDEFGRFCCMVIINLKDHGVHFIGNTFNFFVFATRHMTQNVKSYTYLDGTVEECFAWWLMPAKIH